MMFKAWSSAKHFKTAFKEGAPELQEKNSLLIILLDTAKTQTCNNSSGQCFLLFSGVS